MTDDKPSDWLDAVRRHPNTCDCSVYRSGEMEPCDKTAIAVIWSDADQSAWPVCAWHANRYHQAVVPLRELFERIDR